MAWGVGNRKQHNKLPRTTGPAAGDQWLSGIIQKNNWLAGVQFIEFMTFNVESEFLSLFVHGYKTAESREFGRGQSGVETTTLGGNFL